MSRILRVIRLKKDARGTILIEFVGSFLLFVLLIISILTLVNIVAAQARVHYALTQTANTLSTYGYVLNVLKLDTALMNIDKGSGTVRDGVNTGIEDINQVLDGINSINPSDVIDGGEAVIGDIDALAESANEDPKAMLQLLMQYALNEGASLALGEALRPLMLHYLDNGDMSGEEYLDSVRIGELKFAGFRVPQYNAAGEEEFVGSLTGLEDSNSILLNRDGNVKLTVQYEIEYSFFGLQLPWGEGNPKLKVAQSVMTKMWLGGAGDGYKRAD